MWTTIQDHFAQKSKTINFIEWMWKKNPATAASSKMQAQCQGMKKCFYCYDSE